MSKINSAIHDLTQNPVLKDAYDRQAAIVHVGNMLRSQREEAGLSQEGLAKRTNINLSVISKLEAVDNNQMPDLDILIAIAHACGQRLLLGNEIDKTLLSALHSDETFLSDFNDEKILLTDFEETIFSDLDDDETKESEADKDNEKHLIAI